MEPPKLAVCRGFSFSKEVFSGSMLVFGGVVKINKSLGWILLCCCWRIGGWNHHLENESFCTHVICTSPLMFFLAVPGGFRSLLLRMSQVILVWFVSGISGWYLKCNCWDVDFPILFGLNWTTITMSSKQSLISPRGSIPLSLPPAVRDLRSANEAPAGSKLWQSNGLKLFRASGFACNKPRIFYKSTVLEKP